MIDNVGALTFPKNPLGRQHRASLGIIPGSNHFLEIHRMDHGWWLQACGHPNDCRSFSGIHMKHMNPLFHLQDGLRSL